MITETGKEYDDALGIFLTRGNNTAILTSREPWFSASAKPFPPQKPDQRECVEGNEQSEKDEKAPTTPEVLWQNPVKLYSESGCSDCLVAVSNMVSQVTSRDCTLTRANIATLMTDRSLLWEMVCAKLRSLISSFRNYGSC